MVRRTIISLACLTAVACAGEPPAPMEHAGMSHPLASRGVGALGPEILSQLAEVRSITAQFHDLDAARAAGYTVWSPDPFAPGATCPSNAEGNMGYHLVNVPLRGGAANPAAGDAVIDPLRPEMLLYEKRPDGQVHLVGVEYIVFQAAWEREHGAGAAPPTVFGQPLLFSVHTFPGNPNPLPHYELHVWIFTSNPLGMFYPWNPTVSC
ncbi:MAG TPA: hypothetical protein VGP95_00195 [Gemmatimonadaceae bacterium]|jgi:hypothetical protein|nr:hypothetical protein [Gemmatimonadaceae bacterium]